MRHLQESDDVFRGYVAKPGDYGYFDWDKVDMSYARLLTPIEEVADGVTQTVKLSLAAPLLVAFTLYHKETGQFFIVHARIDDETYMLRRYSQNSYMNNKPIAVGERLWVRRYPLL